MPGGPGAHRRFSPSSAQVSELTPEAMCTAIMYDQPVGRGLGTTQRAIMGELAKLPIEAWPRGIPVVVLAERLGCSDRQIRRAVHSLEARGLVVVVRGARPGRQGLSLIVWRATTYESWQNFINAPRCLELGQQTERDRREWLGQRGLL